MEWDYLCVTGVGLRNAVEIKEKPTNHGTVFQAEN